MLCPISSSGSQPKTVVTAQLTRRMQPRPSTTMIGSGAVSRMLRTSAVALSICCSSADSSVTSRISKITPLLSPPPSPTPMPATVTSSSIGRPSRRVALMR